MEEYSFSNKDIALACESVEKFLFTSGAERREALSLKLAFEEALLEYRERFGEEATYKLKLKKRLSTFRVEVILKGESFNPLAGEEGSDLITSLLENMGIKPGWSYKNGRNFIAFAAKKKATSQTVKMLAAIVLSIIAGILLSALPPGLKETVSEKILTPFTNLFMGLISAVAGPLVFLSVLGSICSMGDMETFGKIGKKTISAIFLYTALGGALMTVCNVLFYDISRGGAAGSDFTKVFDLIYDIVPSNLFEPFLTGNVLQIIFIAILFGMAMLMLSSKISDVYNVVDQLNKMVQTVIGIISAFLPYAVFVIFTKLIISGELKNLLASWKMVVIMTVLMVLYFVMVLLWVSLKNKISPILLLKKIMPTMIIALTTASSVAAFSTNIKDSHEKLGINNKTVNFGIPLGQAMFKPSVIIFLCALQLASAESYNMDITIAWIVLGYITNLLLSFAMPSVLGGIVAGLTIGITQLGLPVEVMGLALALSSIMDFPATAMNTTCWQLVMVNVADSLDQVDKDVLHKKPIHKITIMR